MTINVDSGQRLTRIVKSSNNAKKVNYKEKDQLGHSMVSTHAKRHPSRIPLSVVKKEKIVKRQKLLPYQAWFEKQ